MYDTRSTMRRLISFIDRDRPAVALAVAAMILGSIMLALAPAVAGDIADQLSSCIEGGMAVEMSEIASMTFLAAGLYIVGRSSYLVAGRSLTKVARNVAFNSRRAIHGKLLRIPVDRIDEMRHGDVTARFTSDMVSMETLVDTDVPSLMSHSILLAVVLAAMFIIDAELALIYAAILPLSFAAVYVMMRVSRRGFEEQQDAIGELNAAMAETLSDHPDRGPGRKAFDEANDRCRRSFVTAHRATGRIQPLCTLASNIGYIAVALCGALMMLSGDLTIGVLLTFLIYGQMLGGPLASAAGSLYQVQAGFTALERLYRILDMEEHRCDEQLDEL